MDANPKRFHGVVRFNEAGELICFCPLEVADRGQCKCQTAHNCPEAVIDITVLPNSRPSDKLKATTAGIKKTIEKTNREFQSNIKKGIAQLEKAVRDTKRFRI